MSKRHANGDTAQGGKKGTTNEINAELKGGKIMSKSPTTSPKDEGNTCSICQDTESYKDMYALPCAHKFHELCINEWLKKKSICPICRFRVGDASDAYDEGLGEGQDFETFDDELIVLDHTNGVVRRSHIEFITSDGEEDEELLIGQFSGESEESSDEESQSSSDEGLQVHVELNISFEDNESDTEPESNESNAETDHGALDSSSETSESYNEPETIELDDESETSESDDERYVSEPEEAQDTSESPHDESESSESYDDPGTIDSDDESGTSESNKEPSIYESEEEQETNESDNGSDFYESNSDSYYDSDTD